MSRTCEIFGVSTLVISNLNIIEDAEFKALSMSSENWLNIEQVLELLDCYLTGFYLKFFFKFIMFS